MTERAVTWSASAKVIDMTAFHRMVENGLGATRIAKGLGVTVSTAQKVMKGLHWQQDPARVEQFNAFHLAHIDPETGIPTAEDLERFANGAKRAASVALEMGVSDAADLVKMVGVPAHSIAEATRRLTVLAGREAEVPDKLDTEYFKGQVDKKLARLLLFIDDIVMAQANLKDLTGAFSSLTMIRQLLRGEPTQIISYEQRMKLDEVGRRVIAEMGRRGVKMDTPVIDAPYREVTAQ